VANLGTDIGTFAELDVELSGRELLATDIAWRFITDEGSYFGDRKYGYNIRQFLNEEISAQRLVAIQGRCAIEALKDDRVKSATVQVALTNIDGTKRKLTVTVNLVDADGPFQFIVAVESDKFTVKLLQGNP